MYELSSLPAATTTQQKPNLRILFVNVGLLETVDDVSNEAISKHRKQIQTFATAQQVPLFSVSRLLRPYGSKFWGGYIYK